MLAGPQSLDTCPPALHQSPFPLLSPAKALQLCGFWRQMTTLPWTAFGALHQPAPLLSCRTLILLPDAPPRCPEGEAVPLGMSCDCCSMCERCPQEEPGL